MATESATYIYDLDVTLPLATDNPNEGDNHIRLIKAVTKASFPNVTGAVTPTHTELNYVDGVTSNIQTQLDSKFSITAASGTGGGTLSAARFQVYVFTGSSPASHNLPTSPSVGDMVIISNGGSATLTVGRNGKNIDGVSSDKTVAANVITFFAYGNYAADSWTAS